LIASLFTLENLTASDLIDAHPRHDWLLKAIDQRLREEFAKIGVQIDDEKSRVVDLARGESFQYFRV